MDPRYKIGMRNIKTAMSVGICLIFFQMLGVSDGIQASITAIICMKSSLQNTFHTGVERVIGTVIGAVLGIFALLLIERTSNQISTILAFLGVVLIIYLCNIFKVQPSVIIGVIVFLIILVGDKNLPPIFYGVMRLAETIFGIIITYLINRFIDPKIFIRKSDQPLSPKIQSSNDEDLPKVMSIWLKSNIDSHPFIDEQHWHANYDLIRNKYKTEAEIYLFLEDDKILGYISILNYSEIDGIYLLKEGRKKKIETQLLKYCKHHYPCLYVKVFVDNKNAVDFYTNNNFYIVSEETEEITGYNQFNMQWSLKS